MSAAISTNIRNKPTEQAKAFEKDQIVFCMGGCSMQLPTWYKVVKLTKKTVWLQELQDHLISADHWGQAGKKMPLDIPANASVFNKRIKNWKDQKGYGGGKDQEYCFIKYWGLVEPWDGEPKTYDSYD